jgi:serine protease Do
MNVNQNNLSGARLAPRRSKFLGSAAAVAMAIVVAGGALGYEYGPAGLSTTQARAAEAVQPAGFADLVARVKPAVISVRVKMDSAQQSSMKNKGQGDASPFQENSPLNRFFRQFGFNDNGQRFGFNGPNNRMTEPRRMVTGVGSGFFISAAGYAVTNNHVVDHATSVQVTTDEGKIYTAKVVGTDPTTDLALIKVDAKDTFAHVNFAEHAPRIGDWVVAVGNPFGLGGTVTAGIVSASARDIGSGPYDYIQIDAPINKGNSGGPTFDINGNVIGVNTAIFSPSGGSVGIGFDVPAETAKHVVAQLKDQGHVTRGWMGVQIQSITPEIAESLGMKEARGAIVAEPQAGSPAAKAGIEAGDVITSLNGTPIKDSRDVARKVGMMAPGSSVKIDLVRNGQTKSMTFALGEMPNQQVANAADQPNGSEAGTPHLGLSLAPAGDVAGSGNRGVVVTGVEPNGPAAEHGFQTGDVILDVAGKAVNNAADVRKALKDAKTQGRHDVLMRVKSADATKFVAMPLANG